MSLSMFVPDHSAMTVKILVHEWMLARFSHLQCGARFLARRWTSCRRANLVGSGKLASARSLSNRSRARGKEYSVSHLTIKIRVSHCSQFTGQVRCIDSGRDSEDGDYQ